MLVKDQFDGIVTSVVRQCVRDGYMEMKHKALREQNRTQQHLRNAGIRAKPINPRGASMAFDEGIAA